MHTVFGVAPLVRRARQATRRSLIAATAIATIGGSLLVATPAFAAPTIVASDSFDRTVADGWGTASRGGAYLGTFSPGAASVAQGAGRLSLGAGKGASVLLGNSVAGDVRADMKIRVDQVSASSYYAFVLRSQSDGSQYRGRFELNSTGFAFLGVSRIRGGVETSLARIKLAAPVTNTDWYRLSFTVTGQSPVDVRATFAKDSSPAIDPQLTYTDADSARITSAGRVGWWGYVSTSAKTETVLSTDDLTFTDGSAALSKAEPSASATPIATPTATSSPTPTPTASSTPASSPTPAPTSSAGGGTGDGQGGASGTVGSAPVGSTEYPVPAGAIFVDPAAKRSGDGTKSSPYTSVQTAVEAAPKGATIVLRGGVYHQTVTIPYGKPLTVQAFPKEAVWFDGSVPVSSWSAVGSTWVAGGWTAQFSQDMENGQMARFIAAGYPMASHPDQLFVDGVAQKQVASASQVVAGSFAVDYATKRLILGTDPRGKEVRASDLSQAFNVIAQDSTLQGFGVRRYATTYGERGTVRMQNINARAQNLVIVDNAMIGLTISNNNGAARNITAQGNGLLGIGFDLNYNALLRDCLVTGNNAEHFKPAPVSGGVKITRSRGVLVQNNVISANDSAGLWFDQSNYDVRVIRNTITDNATTNIELEISDTAVVAGNRATGGETGILTYNSGNVSIFNNLVGGNRLFGIKLAQDKRRPSDAGAVGLNPRVEGRDPVVTWITRNITVSNNVFAAGGLYSFYARDGESNRAVDTWNVSITGNLFVDPAGGQKMVAWGRGDNASAETYNSPATLAAAKHGDWRNALTKGAPGPDDIRSQISSNSSVAVEIPSAVAGLLGVKSGARILGIP